MSTTTAPATGAHAVVAAAPTRTRVTFGHLLKAEWIKFWTLRSTFWTLASTAVVFLGLVTLVGLAMRSLGAAEAGADATELPFVPLMAATQTSSLAVVVLGVLIITGEYTTGMIRSSLSAAPKRLPVLWAKAAVLGAVTFVVTAVLVGVGAGITSALFSGAEATFDLGDAETQRMLFGTTLFLTTIALFAFAIGALLRHSAAALATVFGLLLVVENAIALIPWQPLQYVTPFLPYSSGIKVTYSSSMIEMANDMNTRGLDLGVWASYGVLVGWVVILLTAAAIRLRTRDA
ncbi:ABC transporter permease subunit [Cellulomonas soli]|uniref:ABC transporter permease subunit n=1 Tax=Cellulomonas soli TaxID=931535 RepID=UPI003F82846C